MAKKNKTVRWNDQLPPSEIIISIDDDATISFIPRDKSGQMGDPMPFDQAIDFIRMGVGMVVNVPSSFEGGESFLSSIAIIDRDIADCRREVVDWIYDHTDFGDKVLAGSDGWESDGQSWSRNLYWESPDGGDTVLGNFHVDFGSSSTCVLNAESIVPESVYWE